jgi:hypothetical protein
MVSCIWLGDEFADAEGFLWLRRQNRQGSAIGEVGHG